MYQTEAVVNCLNGIYKTIARRTKKHINANGFKIKFLWQLPCVTSSHRSQYKCLPTSTKSGGGNRKCLFHFLWFPATFFFPDTPPKPT